jgi:hypothetical protein
VHVDTSKPGDLAIAEHNPTPIRCLETDDEIETGCLAGPIGAKQADHFTTINGKETSLTTQRPRGLVKTLGT